jgi:hypothetical protein
MLRLGQLLLKSSTEYAELLLGVVSVTMGIWLMFPYVHPSFTSWGVEHAVPETWGAILIGSGTLKLIGLFTQTFFVRKLSCMIAALVWLMIALSIIHSGDPRLSPPVIMTFSIFNALIYVKLSAVNQK